MADWNAYIKRFYELSPQEQQQEWEKLTPEQRAQFEAARAGSQPSSPQAAQPQAAKRSGGRTLVIGCAVLLGLGLLGFLGLVVLGTFVTSPTGTAKTPKVVVESQPVDPEVAKRQEELRQQQEEAARKRALASKWAYQATSDDMTGRTSRTATIQSENTVNFSFPYQGQQRASLTLRTHPSYGRDVFLSIEKGQLLCRGINQCQVRVRFDDGEPRTWNANPPSDHSTTVLFLQGYDRFLQQMRRSKVVRIQPEVFQEGQPVFEFQVGGYDHARYTGG